jgi:hypothetical protein
LSVCGTVAAFAFWAIAVTRIFRPGNPDILRVDVGAAVMTGVIAAGCWLVRWRELHDQDKALLLRTLADAVPARPLAKTIPMPRVHRAL